jgi:hypothetical protein
MAQILITIPDTVLQRVLDAVAAEDGWDAASGLTKAQFAKRVLLGELRERVRRHETKLAQESAAATVRASVEQEILLA